MIHRVRVFLLPTLLTLCVVVLGVYSILGSATSGTHAAGQAQPFTQQKSNFLQSILDSGDGKVSEADYKNPPSPICTVPTSSAPNVNTDCEGTAPHNETSIAVNSTNPLNRIGSANDYQLFLSSGGSVNETIYSRAHVTFDGGQSWTTYPIAYHGYIATGDPAVSFDAHGTAYLATLGFVFSQGVSGGNTPDVLVAHSTDGGKTWSTPVRVAHGTGTFTSPGIFNDKEYITAWGNGNAIVTWTVFNDGIKGSYISSPIFASVTHDGGHTWTAGTEISGSAPFCIGSQGGTACDQDQFSVPTVAADGSVYVAFENTYNLDPSSLAFGSDQYLVVKVDPATGQRIAGPYQVAKLVDGVYDYPIDAGGRQTYQDSQFRTNSAGNIIADPANAQHLAVVWSDMRNSTLPSSPSTYNPDPYHVKTNSDIVVSQSMNGGVTWSSPTVIRAPGDQFMPWGAYDASGKLRIGYFDRSYDLANHQYGYTLATETAPGSLQFAFTQLTTKLSDPTQGDRWFSGTTVNSSFPHPTSFLGDYSGIAITPGSSVTLWTDMRLNICFTVRCGSGEDVFFGSAP